MSTFYAKAPHIDLVLEKISDVRLPYDANKWQEEIIGALHEQHPYLPDTQLRLSMNVRNVKEGYAIGNVNVSDRVRIPVIIDQFMLKPFDLFLKDGELQPLTKSTLLSAIEAKHFGEVMPPGAGEASDIFMTNSRPPFDGKYTFASWTEADPKNVEKALSNAFGIDNVEYFMGGDKAVKDVLEAVHNSDFSKVKHEGGVYKARIKNNERRKDVVKSAAVKIEDRQTERLAGGSVKVAGPSGDLVDGLVFDRVYDLTFGPQSTPLFAAGDGSAYDSSQGFYGEQIADAEQLAKVADQFPDVEPSAGDTGVFFWFENHKGIPKLACTSVVKIVDRLTHEPIYYVSSGRTTSVHQSIQKVAELAAGIQSDGLICIPADAYWMPIEQKRAVHGRPNLEVTRDYLLIQENGGNYKIALYRSGLPSEKQDGLVESQARNYLIDYFEPESVDATLLSARANGSVKIAAHHAMYEVKTASGEVDVPKIIDRIRENAKIATRALFLVKDADITPLRQEDLTKLKSSDALAAEIVKAAIAVDDGERASSVDSALGLNIINAQNIYKFLDGIDGLERCKQFCLKLLLASRLGLDIDPDAARTAAYALESIIQDLEQLRHSTMSANDGE